MAVADLARALAVRPSTVSKMLNVLEGVNLTKRIAYKTDARRTLVHLTSAGVEKQDRIRKMWKSLGTELRLGVGPDFPVEHLQRIDQLLIEKLASWR